MHIVKTPWRLNGHVVYPCVVSEIFSLYKNPMIGQIDAS